MTYTRFRQRANNGEGYLQEGYVQDGYEQEGLCAGERYFTRGLFTRGVCKVR
jgi:hypothetical protein